MVTVTPLPALADNYIYLLRDGRGGCAVVDPAEAGPVLAELRSRPARLEALFLTHHHADHVAGVPGLLAELGPVPVYGPALERDRIPGLGVGLEDGDEVEFGGATIRVLHVPGHTRGHLAYHLPREGHLFCGDVLFGAGCGRVFEGTPQEMYRSLGRLAALPDSTRAWCGHEYTRDNLRFARTVDPENEELAERERSCEPPTVPLDLGRELRTNPFLRCTEPALQRAVGLLEPEEVFAALRERKNRFR